MIIIAFSPNTSRIIPKIFCRGFKHCAPIICVTNNRFIMYQFVRKRQISQIYLNNRSMELLHAHGWQFIKLDVLPTTDFMRQTRKCHSCVELCKYAVRVPVHFVITPNQLYTRILKNYNHLIISLIS